MSSDEEVIYVRKKKNVVNDSSGEDEVGDKKDVRLEVKDNDYEESSGNSSKYPLVSSQTNEENNQKNKPRRITTLDSSSEGEDGTYLFDNTKVQGKKQTTFENPKNNKTNRNNEGNKKLKNNNYESSDEEESARRELYESGKSSSLESKTLIQKLYNNTDLYDAEGSSGEEDNGREKCKATFDVEDHDNSNEKDPAEPSKRRNPQNPRKERKSKKKAQEDIKTDIHRESQRLMRQAPISIPYHRPKQRSLAEFLVRRKSTPKVPLQASSELLVSALIEIEQREREAELFYKSESSEDDSEINKEEKKSETDSLVDKCTEVQNTEQTLRSDLAICKDSQENNAEVVTENLDSGGSYTRNVCLEGKNTTEVDTVLTSKNIEKTGNLENKNFFANKTEVDSLSPKKELDNIGNIEREAELTNQTEKLSLNSAGQFEPLTEEPPNTNSQELKNKSDSLNSCIKLSGNLTETNLEENTETQEHINPSIISPTQPAKQSQDIIVKDMPHDDKNSYSNSPSCGLVNTEEFSLKLSESQSEYENMENVPVKSTSTNKIVEINVETITDINTKKELFIEGNKTDAQIDKTGDDLHQIVNEKKETEEQRKLGLRCEEHSFENDLFKKYNIEIKNATVSTPKIIGSHDEVIDLSDEILKSEDNQLMKRFLTHLSYKKKQKKKGTFELSIVSAERDTAGNVSAISEESVKVVVGEGEDEEEDPSLERPGAKRTRLRAQLQLQMERQRNQEWARKQQEQRLYEDEEVFEGEKNVCDGEADVSETSWNGDNKDETEEEEEEEEEEDEEEETENEEDQTDEEVAEKSRKSRSVFLDDEAEESDEELFNKKIHKNKKEKMVYNNDDDGVDDSNDSTVDMDLNDKENNKEKNQDINNKSPEKEQNTKGTISDFFIKRPATMRPGLTRTRTNSDMFSSEDILKYSTDDEEMPSFQKPRLSNDKEDVEEKMPETPTIISPAFQLTALENMDVTNKYNWSAPSTPCKDFLSPKTLTPVRAIPNLVDKSPQICTQDLENMCSGNFTSQPLQETQESAQDFDLFLADDSQLSRDQITPLKSSSKSEVTKISEEELLRTSLVDDEDEPAAKVSNKRAKKLDFSDDEDDCDDGKEDDDKLESEKEGSDEEDVGNGEVEYDSEENEVDTTATAGEFLDVEAELSEEEWSSEDEDERGLDALEMEEADRENIDQRRLKRQLDQIHMKEMLKEDKKQVKLLQEMLLEDGELHSDNKRQRLFRWSNNNAFGEGDNKAVLDSDEEKAEEDEDEENWRKLRHERELFLQEHSKKEERLETLELEESDSQLLRLGQKALKRLNSNSQEPKLTPPTLSNPLASPDAKKPFVLPKRGSFLSRGQQTLSRLAQMVSSTSDGPIQQPKNSRNFVFTSISPTKGEQEVAKPTLVPNKRKVPHLPLPIAKKPCVQKSKTVNKKSLFEALTRVNS